MKEIYPQLLSVVLGVVIGYLIKYFFDRNLQKRQDELALVNEKLREFYGPMLALLESSHEAWIAFTLQYKGADPFELIEEKHDEQAKEDWRIWMKEVFMPINLKMSEIVQSRLDLIRGEEMPAELTRLTAHVARYKVLIRRWENHDFSRHVTKIKFPHTELKKFIGQEFVQLKQRQQELARKR